MQFLVFIIYVGGFLTLLKLSYGHTGMYRQKYSERKLGTVAACSS